MRGGAREVPVGRVLMENEEWKLEEYWNGTMLYHHHSSRFKFNWNSWKIVSEIDTHFWHCDGCGEVEPPVEFRAHIQLQKLKPKPDLGFYIW
jgi:hypothetical protein